VARHRRSGWANASAAGVLFGVAVMLIAGAQALALRRLRVGGAERIGG